MKHKVLRGERILQAIEEDATYNQLRQNIQRGFPATRKRQHATGEVNVTNMQYVPVANGLQVKATSRSNGHNYAQTIIFSDIKYQPDGGEGTTTFTGTDGSERNIQPVALQGARVKVQCSCLDFHYRFANHNHQADALVGKPPPLYQRVPGSNRPPVNPQQVSGICKHIIKVVDALKQNGVIGA